MARLFDNANPDYLETDTALLTAAPFTVSCRFRLDDLANEAAIWWLGDKDVTSENWDAAVEDPGSGSFFEITARTAGGSADAGTGVPSINTWHHGCIVEASATSHSAFLDGASKDTSGTSRVPAGADRTAIGRRGDSSPGAEWSGDLAQIAAWDVALVDQNVATVANGWSPRQVVIDSLVAFWPINGQSPEPDIVGGLNLTVFGTPSVSEEPPIPRFLVAA